MFERGRPDVPVPSPLPPVLPRVSLRAIFTVTRIRFTPGTGFSSPYDRRSGHASTRVTTAVALREGKLCSFFFFFFFFSPFFSGPTDDGSAMRSAGAWLRRAQWKAVGAARGTGQKERERGRARVAYSKRAIAQRRQRASRAGSLFYGQCASRHRALILFRDLLRQTYYPRAGSVITARIATPPTHQNTPGLVANARARARAGTIKPRFSALAAP